MGRRIYFAVIFCLVFGLMSTLAADFFDFTKTRQVSFFGTLVIFVGGAYALGFFLRRDKNSFCKKEIGRLSFLFSEDDISEKGKFSCLKCGTRYTRGGFCSKLKRKRGKNYLCASRLSEALSFKKIPDL